MARAQRDATVTHSVTSLVARVQPARICFTHVSLSLSLSSVVRFFFTR
jgi:hypothetical protein